MLDSKLIWSRGIAPRLLQAGTDMLYRFNQVEAEIDENDGADQQAYDQA